VARSRGISLANKCQLLFGGAVLAIVIAALIGPWVRLPRIVDDAQMETTRQIADLWAVSSIFDTETASRFRPGARNLESGAVNLTLDIQWWPLPEWESHLFEEGFQQAAQKRLSLTPEGRREYVRATWDTPGSRIYRYARRIDSPEGVPLGVLTVERRSETVAAQLFVNRLFLIAAGVLAGSLAMTVFWVITRKIILRPVRVLRDTAALVTEGGLNIRSDLRTGDEFEELSNAFNVMLTSLEQQQQQLRGINNSLDLRVSELSERNSALYEAARLKGEFLANVSHELRTPLNSIIGFADLLREQARADGGTAPDPAAVPKRLRYLDNIVTAGRTLLEMIEDLLAMARIEAGTIEVHADEVEAGPLCEGLLALIRPLAERKNLRLELQMPMRGGGVTGDAGQADLPVITTDKQKFQQIVFNFLSNAVKFTPEGGHVVLRAERLVGSDRLERLRVSVLDTGPGIPPSQREFIFEKFSQIDMGPTKRHQGTGLGLAIAREFAELLQGEIQLVSEVGRGSMFSVILPPTLDAQRVNESKRKLVERAAVARRPAPPRVNVS